MKALRKHGVLFFQLPNRDLQQLTVHSFFTRKGGVSVSPFDSLNVGISTGDSLAAREENLKRLSSAIGIPQQSISLLRQTHGSTVVPIEALPRNFTVFTRDDLPVGDAQITDTAGIALGVLTADCLPILVLDPIRPAIGAVHAGWRGTLQKIALRTLEEMQKRFGTDPGRLMALMGPCIGPCCYTVGRDVARAFLDVFSGTERFLHPGPPGSWRLDLRVLNSLQLEESGVGRDQILNTPLCTSCRVDLFFSARRQGDPSGRQISLMGLFPGGKQILQDIPGPAE